MPNKNNSRNRSSVLPIKRILISALVGCGLYFIMLILFAVVVLKTGLENSFYLPFGIANAAATAFVSGFVALLKIKEKAFQFGSLTGLVQAFVSLTVMFILNGANGGKGLLIQFIVMLVFSLVGGVVSANLKVKNKFRV